MLITPATNGSPSSPAIAGSIRIESYDPGRDYPLIQDWWGQWHDSPAPPPNCLPIATTYMAFFNERPVACLSLYLMNADVAQIAFPIGDPHAPTKAVIAAMKALIATAIASARAHMHGRGFVWFQTHNEGIHRLMCQAGFTETAPPFASHMIFQPDFDPDILSP